MFLPFVMVFVFFLIGALVAVSVFFSLTRPGAPWEQMVKGGHVSWGGHERHPIDIDGRKVFASYDPGTSKRPSKMTLSFKGDFFAHAVFRREKGLDRFGKDTGINAEIQLNDQRFDSKVYIECEDQDFIFRLIGSSEAKAHLEGILKIVDAFEINGDHCVINRSPCDDPAYLRSQELRQAAVSMLALADHMPRPQPGQRSLTPLTDESVRDTRMLTAFAALIFVAGLALLLWGLASFMPLFPGKIFQKAVLLMIPSATIMVLFFFTAVRGRSTGLNAMFLLLFLSVLGVVLSCFGGALVFNGARDVSAQVRHETSLIEKYTTHHKSTYTYHIRVSSWRDDLPWYDFTVPYGAYQQMNVGSACVVTTKSGALGVPWVVGRSC